MSALSNADRLAVAILVTHGSIGWRASPWEKRGKARVYIAVREPGLKYSIDCGYFDIEWSTWHRDHDARLSDAREDELRDIKNILIREDAKLRG